MHKDKIMCGGTTERDLKELNMAIENENNEGYAAIDISSSTPGEICVLLCKKVDR